MTLPTEQHEQRSTPAGGQSFNRVREPVTVTPLRIQAADNVSLAAKTLPYR